jgi:hypothetical protein
VITDALTLQVLARFAEELAEAGSAQFDHLAERAEGRYTTELGDRMREMVDYERAMRAVA